MSNCLKCAYCIMKVEEEGVHPYCPKLHEVDNADICKEYISAADFKQSDIRTVKITLKWGLYLVWNEVVKTLCRIIFYIPHKRAKTEDIPNNSEYCDKCPHYRYINRNYEEDSVWCVYCNDNDGMLLWDGVKICGEGLTN